ncbi:MAG: hydroxyacylglutathione hydrolase [Gammaproteobacteria bacterium]
MLSVKIIPALNDNYIYLAAANNRAAIIDPGESAPALAALAHSGAVLEAVLITHRHADHIGGVAEILRRHPKAKIYAPAGVDIPNIVDGDSANYEKIDAPAYSKIRAEICADGGEFSILDGALPLQIIATPGHTIDHIAFYGGGVLFSGDTLFACGCGRVFEGTMKQMRRSVAALAVLPDETKVYCGHEYTESNINFATAADPENAALQTRQKETAARRAKNAPTVPFTIAEEKATNPYLRLRAPSIIAAATARLGRPPKNEDETFAALREWKDIF